MGLQNLSREPGVPNFFSSVKNILIVASSSRGGSSFFAEILKRSPELLHFQGEINPFLNLAGLSRTNSDQLTEADAARPDGTGIEKLSILERQMAFEAGAPLPGPLSTENLGKFKRDLAWRLSIQWPDIIFSAEKINQCVEKAKDSSAFSAIFLKEMHVRYPKINPYYYDIDRSLIEKHFPEVKPNFGPPSLAITEEPPFILAVPWRTATRDDLQRKTLVIKTPSNAYRLPFLRKLFPNAKFRILHLTRNPAAAINGLYDGWRHHGFFSRRVEQTLAIAGYSDHFPDWAQHWWKFDLPPGWEAFSQAPLEQVCGFQWRSAHKAILNFIDKEKPETFKLRFEDILEGGEKRKKCFQDFAKWLGVDGETFTANETEIGPVMATAQPEKRRWVQKIAILEPVLSDSKIQETAAKLGYEEDRGNWL